MRRIQRTGLLALGLGAAIVAACGGAVTSTTPPGGATSQPGGATSQPGGGAAATGMPVTDLTKLCDLLGPGDFSSVGINGASVATVNSEGPGSAYCSFTAQSAAQGGIELDVFVDDDADDAEGTYQTILDEIGPVKEFSIPGVDASAGTDGVAGQPDKPASVVVRKGKLVFTIAAPGGANSSVALTQLAVLVLARGAGLAG